MTRFRSGGRLTVFALGCICAGLVFRLGISLRSPVSYDEVFVMGIGLDKITSSARDFVIDVPLRHSNAITPLWWWVQAVPALLAGRISLWGLRLAPLLLGGVTLIVTFRVAKSRLGHGPAALLVMFAAVSDVLAFSNSRGEFAESLLLLWVLPCVCLVGDRRSVVTKGLLGWLILMTHLGKGLLLVGALALADAVAQTVRYRKPGAALRPLISLAVAVVPTFCWLTVACGLTTGGPMLTDIGTVAGPGEMLWKLTARHGETKAHMIAAPLDAVQVWLDGWVWPVSAVSAFPLLVGMIAAVGRPRGRRGSLSLGLMFWVGLGLVILVARGMVGARFHLLYLPAVWLSASIGLWRLRCLRPERLLALGGLWVVSVWAAFSWTGWEERLWSPPAFAFTLAGAWSLVVVLAYVGRWRRWAAGRAAAGCASATVVVMMVLVFGPLQWAPFARMEPCAGCEELTAIDAYRLEKARLPGYHNRTLYIDLANYFIHKDHRTIDDLRRAEHYARLETERVPCDARAWFYHGETLRRLGASPERVRAAWERSYELNPTSMLEQRLQDLRRTIIEHDPRP